MKQLLKTTVNVYLLLAASFGSAQSASPPLPEVTLMPWRTYGLLSETRHLAKAALGEAAKKLEEVWITDAKPFSDTLDSKKFSINTLNAAKVLKVGRRKGLNVSAPLLLQPIWSVLANNYILMVQVGRSDIDTLLSSVHVTFSKEEWQKQNTEALRISFLENKMQKLAAEALTKTAALTNAPSGHALQVGFTLVRESGRYDTGALLSLNLLLAEKLAENPETLIRSVGGEGVHLLRYTLGLTATQLRRSSRVVNLDWRLVNPNPKSKPALPVNFELTMDFTESVFGKKIQTPKTVNYAFAINNEKIVFDIDKDLKEFLKREQASLRLSDMPQVSKVYGAWVYLDRGRAFGLKMEDRLTAGTEVSGHVVGFYGPELALNSPRGFPVEEGAIVFIRKGQDKTKVGLEFEFDKKTYPTNWPPN